MRWLIAAVVIATLACGDRTSTSARSAVSISVALPGADPATVEASVAVPLDRAVIAIAGVDSIASRSVAGRAIVTLELERGADLDTVVQDVQRAIVAVLPNLPRDALTPYLSRTRLGDEPVMWLAVRGTTSSVVERSSIARNVVRDRLMRLPGVGDVDLHDVVDVEVTAQVDPVRLESMNVTIVEVLAAMRAGASNLAAGRIDTTGGTVHVAGLPTGIQELGNLVVLSRKDGAVVRLRDLASIEVKLDRSVGPADPKLAIRAQSGADPGALPAAIRRELATLTLPRDMTVVEVVSPASQRPPAPLVVSLRGPDLDVLRSQARAIVADLRADVVVDPDLVDVPRATFPIDHDRAAALGVSSGDIYATLAAIEGTRTGTLFEQGSHHDIVLRIDSQQTLPPVHVRGQGGKLVPLDSLVAQVSRAVPAVITRRDHERVITLSFYTQLDEAEQRVRTLPPGYRAVVQRR